MDGRALDWQSGSGLLRIGTELFGSLGWECRGISGQAVVRYGLAVAECKGPDGKACHVTLGQGSLGIEGLGSVACGSVVFGLAVMDCCVRERW